MPGLVKAFILLNTEQRRAKKEMEPEKQQVAETNIEKGVGEDVNSSPVHRCNIKLYILRVRAIFCIGTFDV